MFVLHLLYMLMNAIALRSAFKSEYIFSTILSVSISQVIACSLRTEEKSFSLHHPRISFSPNSLFLVLCRLTVSSNDRSNWHSPQLKQGDSCFSHYCIGKHLTVLQCLTQCPQAIFILFPYALRYSFYLYADCICSPFFRILILAFVSRSWTAWHLGHSQIRMPRFFIRGFL